MKMNAVGLTLLLSAVGLVSCGVGIQNTSLPAKAESAAVSRTDSEEDVDVAPLALTGLGDRFCSLRFWIVRKDEAGNFKRIAASKHSDDAPRAGFGKGCLEFCLAAFNEMRAVNNKNGNDILIHSCAFSKNSSVTAEQASPAPAPSASPEASPAASTTPPSQPPFVTKEETCKIVQADQVVIFAESRTRAACVTECESKATTNPQRRCEWGEETLRAHPLNACSI